MLTRPAAATDHFVREVGIGVHRREELLRMGVGDARLRANLAAGRWQRIGRAVVLHNGPPSKEEVWEVARLNCGPRAALASFTALEGAGLTGWERDDVHVVAPEGTQRPALPGVPLILHRTTRPIATRGGGQAQDVAPAAVLAASSFLRPRAACGILAAVVQQRLASAHSLGSAVSGAVRIRHRRILRAAVRDIEMGAEALSEIDFVSLCRRNGLPRPRQQAVRVERSGRRRYLDAEWSLKDGRRVAAEVDGAVHLAPRRWYDDQVRQNELVLGGTVVLCFPSVVVRTEEPLVVDQLRRALFGS